jgi:DNA segregation ATPase FtsK/SpoIIIE, S-DNA-T family
MGRDKNKKKKITKEKEGEFDSRPAFGLSRETKNGIWGIACLGLAIITTLALFGRAGSAGDLFADISKMLFGWGIFLAPLGFVMLAASFLKSISHEIYVSAIAGTILFILGFLAAFYIFGSGDFAVRVNQGGYLGLALGYPLLKLVGPAASYVVLTFLLVISVMISLDIPINRLAFWIKRKEDGEEILSDNVVIKQGAQIIDQKANEEAQRKQDARDKRQPVAVPVRVDEDKEFVIKASKSGKWVLPPVEILHSDKEQPRSGDINANVAIIRRTLSNFGIDVEMGEVSIGPTVTQFTLRPAVGVKISKITGLNNDLALALAAHPIRIEAPIPGKALVGIEVPNKKSAVVGLRDLIDADDFKKSRFFLPLALGRDVAGFPVYAGLEKMPHILIAGATGTGKSVAINSILTSLLYRHSPDMLKLILVDPKRVELSLYNGIRHLITPVIVDNKKVIHALRWAVREMEKRYEGLSVSASRDIFSYNAKQAEQKKELMPFIVIVVDELADLMASHGRDVEAAIVRLAQMARAVGIHLIVSTQRPSVEVITGLIKANITTRIAFQVASQIDSRTILDTAGAEKLLGNGDMLYQSGDTAKLKRIQGSFVSEKEVKDVVRFIKQQAEELEPEEAGEEDRKSVV